MTVLERVGRSVESCTIVVQVFLWCPQQESEISFREREREREKKRERERKRERELLPSPQYNDRSGDGTGMIAYMGLPAMAIHNGVILLYYDQIGGR
jgi:hypothetical protein